MTIAQRLAEAPPAVRWHTARLASRVLYPRAFATFGRGSVIVRPLALRGTDRIHIGADVSVFPGAWLQCEPGGGPLTIGDGVYLGHDVHVHADDPISIGRRSVLADGVFVASTDHVGGDPAIGSVGSGPVTIGEQVFLGQRAVVLGGVTIGDGAVVGAGAVVTRDVAPGAVVGGVPARVIKDGRS